MAHRLAVSAHCHWEELPNNSSRTRWSWLDRRIEAQCGRRKWSERYRWSCSDDVTPQMLCQRLSGHRVVFVGDSLQQHLYATFVMLMGQKNTHRLSKKETFWPTTICNDSVPVETIRNDYLSEGYSKAEGYSGRWTPPGALHSWGGLLRGTGFEWPWLHALNRSRTIAVINTGAKVFSEVQAQKHMRALIARLALLQQHDRPDLRVVWRSSFPGHPGCTLAEGTPPLRSLDEPRAQQFLVAKPLPTDAAHALFRAPPLGSADSNWTRKIYHSWHVLNRTRLLIDRMAAEAGWLLLDAYTSSVLRPDAHPSGEDCLHFCLPGPLDAVIIQLMALLHEDLLEW